MGEEPGKPDSSAILAPGIDHLVYASATLERGMDEIERLLGVRPVAGGRHPQYGTHNALLSLGLWTYLEIIARDPALPEPGRGALVDIPEIGHSGLVTWVFRPENIRDAAEAGRKAGIGLGGLESGQRKNPDGSVLRWQLTDPYAMPMGGTIPFLIDWGNTVHPARVAPPGGELVELRIHHPEANSVRRALSLLGADVETVTSEVPRISARIGTPGGLITLE